MKGKEAAATLKLKFSTVKLVLPTFAVISRSDTVESIEIFAVKNVNPPSGGLVSSSSRLIEVVVGVKGGAVAVESGRNADMDAVVEAASPSTFKATKFKHRGEKTAIWNIPPQQP